MIADAAAEPEARWYGASLRFVLVGVERHQYDVAFVGLTHSQAAGSVVLAPYQIRDVVGIVNNASAGPRGNDTGVNVVLYAYQRQSLVFAQDLAEFIKALFVHLPASCRASARVTTDNDHAEDVVFDVRDPQDLRRFLHAVFSDRVPVRKVDAADVPDLFKPTTAAAEPEQQSDEQPFQSLRRHLLDSHFKRPIVLDGVRFTLTARGTDVYFYSMQHQRQEKTDAYFTLDLDVGNKPVWTMRVEDETTRVGRVTQNQVDTEASGPTVGRTLSAWIKNALVMVKGLAEKITDEFNTERRSSDRVFYGNFRTGPGRDDYVGVFRVTASPSVFKFNILDDRHSGMLGTVSFSRDQALKMVLSTGKSGDVWAATAFNMWKEKHHAG